MSAANQEHVAALQNAGRLARLAGVDAESSQRLPASDRFAYLYGWMETDSELAIEAARGILADRDNGVVVLVNKQSYKQIEVEARSMGGGLYLLDDFPGPGPWVIGGFCRWLSGVERRGAHLPLIRSICRNRLTGEILASESKDLAHDDSYEPLWVDV